MTTGHRRESGKGATYIHTGTQRRSRGLRGHGPHARGDLHISFGLRHGKHHVQRNLRHGVQLGFVDNKRLLRTVHNDKSHRHHRSQASQITLSHGTRRAHRDGAARLGSFTSTCGSRHVVWGQPSRRFRLHVGGTLFLGGRRHPPAYVTPITGIATHPASTRTTRPSTAFSTSGPHRLTCGFGATWPIILMRPRYMSASRPYRPMGHHPKGSLDGLSHCLLSICQHICGIRESPFHRPNSISPN